MPKHLNRNKNNSFFLLGKKERKGCSDFLQELNTYTNVLLCFSKVMKDFQYSKTASSNSALLSFKKSSCADFHV